MKNGTLGKNVETKAEIEYYEYLKTLFDESDIHKQYFDKERYPFKCDFYVESEDLFIEVHGNWTHGGRPFDPQDEECQKQLADWKERAKNSDYYNEYNKFRMSELIKENISCYAMHTNFDVCVMGEAAANMLLLENTASIKKEASVKSNVLEI